MPDVASALILECRLGRESNEVDLSLCVPSSNSSGQRLLTWTSGAGHSSTFHKLRRFCEAWVTPSSPLCKHVPVLWIEFDFPEKPPSQVPCPNVFTQIGQGRIPSSGETRGSADKHARAALDSALRIFVDEPLAETTARNLATSLTSLPTRAQVAHVGFMLSRRVEAVRFCARVPVELVVHYLKRVGWTGPMDDVIAMLRLFGAFSDSVFVDLDIGKRMLPTIGLEFIMGHRSDTGSNLHRFSDALVDADLCTARKGRELLGWPGSSLHFYPSLPLQTVLRRELSHIKITLSPECAAAAKAYLWCSPTIEVFTT